MIMMMMIQLPVCLFIFFLLVAESSAVLSDGNEDVFGIEDFVDPIFRKHIGSPFELILSTRGRNLRPIQNSTTTTTRRMVNTTTDDDDFVNPCNSVFTQYILDNWPVEVFLSITDRNLTAEEEFISGSIGDLTTIYKMLLDTGNNTENGEYFGSNGEYTTLVVSRAASIEAFWKARSTESAEETTNDDLTSSTPGVHQVLLVGLHGRDLENPENLLGLCESLKELKEEDISLTADSDCNNFINITDGFIQLFPRGYDSPFLTLNAFAVYDKSVSELPLVMLGDGLLEYLESQATDLDYGIDFIIGHEYIHVLQFLAGVMTNASFKDPAVLERLELMADALCAYYLAHEEGGNLSVAETDDVARIAILVGDPMESADVDPTNYHGTPGQRECAALWGAQLARSEVEQAAAAGSVAGIKNTTFMALVDLFNAAYNDIFEGLACPGLTTNVDCDALEEADDRSNEPTGAPSQNNGTDDVTTFPPNDSEDTTAGSALFGGGMRNTAVLLVLTSLFSFAFFC